MTTPRRLRPLITAWAITIALTLLSIGTALADGGGGVYPK